MRQARAEAGVHKLPVSVLVVIHTPQLEVLLLERARQPGWWQSVTGSIDRPDEPLRDAAAREVLEETGIACAPEQLVSWSVVNTYEIFPVWRHRYAPGVEHNVEHVFSLEISGTRPIRLAAGEHTDYAWMPWEAAAEKCFSWSNRDAIRMLPQQAARLIRKRVDR